MAEKSGYVDHVCPVEERHIDGLAGRVPQIAEIGQRKVGELTAAKCRASEADRLQTGPEPPLRDLLEVPEAEQRLTEAIRRRPVQAGQLGYLRRAQVGATLIEELQDCKRARDRLDAVVAILGRMRHRSALVGLRVDSLAVSAGLGHRLRQYTNL